MKKLVIISLAIAIVALSKPAYSEASSLGLKLYPPLIQIRMFHNTSVETPITIQNTGDTPLNLQIAMKPFTASDKNNGQVRFLSGKDLTDFQKFQTEHIALLDGQNRISSLSLSPDQEKSLTLKVNAPKTTTPHDYYFTTAFISNNIQSDQLNATFINVGSGSNVFLTIDPQGQSNTDISQFTTRSIITQPILDFAIKIHNNGTTYTSPHTSLIISNFLGQEIEKRTLKTGLLLSGASKIIRDQLDTNSTSYVYKRNLFPGIYKATLTVLGENDNVKSERILYFTYAPTPLLGTLLVSIFTITLIILKIIKKSKNI